jgi:hypothetical protein
MSGHPSVIAPSEAKAVWDATPKPSLRKVAKRMADAGRAVSFKTLQRWQKAGWTDAKEPAKQIAAAAEKINDAAPALTGDAKPLIAPLDEKTSNAELTEKGFRELMQAGRHLIKVMADTAPAQMLAPEVITKSFANIAEGMVKAMDALTKIPALHGALPPLEGKIIEPENPKLRALLEWKPKKEDAAAA